MIALDAIYWVNFKIFLLTSATNLLDLCDTRQGYNPNPSPSPSLTLTFLICVTPDRWRRGVKQGATQRNQCQVLLIPPPCTYCSHLQSVVVGRYYRRMNNIADRQTVRYGTSFLPSSVICPGFLPYFSLLVTHTHTHTPHAGDFRLWEAMASGRYFVTF